MGNEERRESAVPFRQTQSHRPHSSTALVPSWILIGDLYGGPNSIHGGLDAPKSPSSTFRSVMHASENMVRRVHMSLRANRC